MARYAEVTDVQARLDWTMDSGEQAICVGALDDLSDDVRIHGKDWPLPGPELIKRMVVRAAARYMRNPDGYETSRAGDETVSWGDRGGHNGTASFSSDELKAIKRLANPQSGFGSVGILAHGTRLQNANETLGLVGPLEGFRFQFFSGADEW